MHASEMHPHSQNKWAEMEKNGIMKRRGGNERWCLPYTVMSTKSGVYVGHCREQAQSSSSSSSPPRSPPWTRRRCLRAPARRSIGRLCPHATRTNCCIVSQPVTNSLPKTDHLYTDYVHSTAAKVQKSKCVRLIIDSSLSLFISFLLSFLSCYFSPISPLFRAISFLSLKSKGLGNVVNKLSEQGLGRSSDRHSILCISSSEVATNINNFPSLPYKNCV